MSPLEIARVLFDEGWNQQDFTTVRGLLADEIKLHIGSSTRVTNAADLETIIGGWHAAFADFRFVIHSITAGDHLAAVRATLHGTHRGRWGDLDPTGRSIAVEHAFFLRIDDGLIVEVWEILDHADLETQLTGNPTS